MTTRLRGRIERFELREAFTIARGEKSEAVVLCCQLDDGAHMGRGEAVPYARYGEDPESSLRALESAGSWIASGAEGPLPLPVGAARSALDSALVDLECKRRGLRAWELLELEEPRPRALLVTLPMLPPEVTAERARALDGRCIKLKLGGPEDLDRLRAARASAPRSELVVDANEGWTAESFGRLVPTLIELGVTLVEQPLPAADDAALRGLDRGSLRICADESFQGEAGVAELADRYDAINVKLDKAGGLRPALAAIESARAVGLEVMLGSMVCTSLSIAPATLAMTDARWVDLDGAQFLAADRESALEVDAEGRLHPPSAALWG